PPLAVVILAAGVVAGAVGLITGTAWLALGWLPVAGYAALVLAGGLAIGSGLPLAARLLLPAVLATMHVCWGAGFVLEAVTRRRSRATATPGTAPQRTSR